MSDAINNAKNWEIGSIRKNKNGKSYISFDKNVRIMVGDREVDLGEFNVLYLNEPLEQLNYLLEKQYIDQDQYAERVQTVENKSIKSVLKAKLV